MSTDPSPEVTILGAGVVGVATAWAAARQGLSVELVDRAAGPALGASFANGGQLSYAYTDAMAGPSLWKQIPALLCGSDPAFRLRLSGNPTIWRWGLSLLGQAGSARMQRNTLATLRLAQVSQRAMEALLERHPIDFQHAVAGKLHLYFSRQSLRTGLRMVDLKRPHGVRQTVLDAAGVADIEPAVAQAKGLVGAVYSPEEAVGDPWRFAVGLLEVLQRQYPVRTRFDFDLDRIQRRGGRWLLGSRQGEQVEARRLIVCTGIDSAALLRPLGIRLPLMAIKGHSFTAPCGPQAPATSITDTARKIVFCRLGDRIRVAGLADINDWSPAVDAGRFRQLVELARQSLPEAADYDQAAEPWAGLRPATPDSIPVIANVGPGLTCNTGHGMLGWTLAMGSGEKAVALAMGSGGG